MKHDIDNRASALTTIRGLLHCPKTSWTYAFKLDLHLPTLRKLCQVRLRGRRSANGTKPSFV